MSHKRRSATSISLRRSAASPSPSVRSCLRIARAARAAAAGIPPSVGQARDCRGTVGNLRTAARAPGGDCEERKVCPPGRCSSRSSSPGHLHRHRVAPRLHRPGVDSDPFAVLRHHVPDPARADAFVDLPREEGGDAGARAPRDTPAATTAVLRRWPGGGAGLLAARISVASTRPSDMGPLSIQRVDTARAQRRASDTSARVVSLDDAGFRSRPGDRHPPLPGTPRACPCAP
jgi:hypothetical protein